MSSNYDWAESVLLQCSPTPPITQNNLDNFARWMAAENPVDDWYNHENPLNINAGGTGFDTFPNLSVAATRTAQVLSQSNMRGILDALVSNAPLASFSEAVVAAPWAASHYGGNPLFFTEIPLPAVIEKPGSDPTPEPPPTPAPIPVPPQIIKPLTGRFGMLNAPIVAVVPTWTGKGYTLVGADGGTFNYGDAPYYGSLAGLHLNAPIVDAARTPDGKGLVLVGTDGGVFCFGDAAFEGSEGGTKLNAPVISIGISPTGKGYWLTAADGGVFTFGDAPFAGSAA